MDKIVIDHFDLNLVNIGVPEYTDATDFTLESHDDINEVLKKNTQLIIELPDDVVKLFK